MPQRYIRGQRLPSTLPWLSLCWQDTGCGLFPLNLPPYRHTNCSKTLQFLVQMYSWFHLLDIFYNSSEALPSRPGTGKPTSLYAFIKFTAWSGEMLVARCSMLDNKRKVGGMQYTIGRSQKATKWTFMLTLLTDYSLLRTYSIQYPETSI